jgi:rhomboid protease GluP
MPNCLKCGAELAVNEEGVAPVLCDRCAGRATSRARRGLKTGTLADFPATSGLVAINILVLLGMIVTGGVNTFGPRNLILWGANYGPLTLSGEYWRLVTAGFVHGGVYHIAFNMWALWSLGRLSERLFGSSVTFAVYVLTGVGGSMLSLATDPGRFEVGASGAIFGLAGAILTGIRFGNVAVSSFERRAIFSSLTFFILFNLAIGFGLVSVGVGIDNMCHLGGLITGLAFGAPLATSAASGRKSFEWITILLVSLAMAAAGAQLVRTKAQASKLAMADTALNAHEYETAISILEDATASRPNDAEAQSMLGDAYAGSRQLDKAVAAYRRALLLEPNLPGVREKLQELQNASK